MTPTLHLQYHVVRTLAVHLLKRLVTTVAHSDGRLAQHNLKRVVVFVYVDRCCPTFH